MTNTNNTLLRLEIPGNDTELPRKVHLRWNEVYAATLNVATTYNIKPDGSDSESRPGTKTADGIVRFMADEVENPPEFNPSAYNALTSNAANKVPDEPQIGHSSQTISSPKAIPSNEYNLKDSGFEPDRDIRIASAQEVVNEVFSPIAEANE